MKTVMETNKNVFICFIDKIITYTNPIPNDTIISIYNGITAYFMENFFIVKIWITINKIEKDTKIGPLWKRDPLWKGYHLANTKRDKTNVPIIRTIKVHIVNKFMSDIIFHFCRNVAKKDSLIEFICKDSFLSSYISNGKKSFVIHNP